MTTTIHIKPLRHLRAIYLASNESDPKTGIRNLTRGQAHVLRHIGNSPRPNIERAIAEALRGAELRP